jgi:hypothetical protein
MHRVLCLCSVLLFAVGCQGAFAHVQVTGGAHTTLPGAPVSGRAFTSSTSAPLATLELAAPEAASDEGVRAEDIVSAELIGLTLRTEQADLAFLDDVEIYLSSAGFDPVLLGAGSQFAEGQALAELTVEDVDLRDHLLDEAPELLLRARGLAPAQPTTLSVDYLLRVGVTFDGVVRASKQRDDR